jgi:hypothetical protein
VHKRLATANLGNTTLDAATRSSIFLLLASRIVVILLCFTTWGGGRCNIAFS